MKNGSFLVILLALCPFMLTGCTPMGVTIDSPADGAIIIGPSIDLAVSFSAASTCTGGERCRPEMDWWIYIDGTEACHGGIEDGDGDGLYSWCPMTNVPGEFYCHFHWYIPTSDLGSGAHTIEVVGEPNNTCNDEGSDTVTVNIP